MTPEERFARIEANLDRVTALLVDTAERQSLAEHRQEQTDTQIKQLIAAVAEDGENIRALARIAEAHQRRLDDIDGGGEPS